MLFKYSLSSLGFCLKLYLMMDLKKRVKSTVLDLEKDSYYARSVSSVRPRGSLLLRTYL